MALSRHDMQNKSQTQALTVHVHAPEYSGFTHTIPTRFFHFEGSGAGVRDEFGMSAKNLAVLLDKFQENFLRTEEKIRKDSRSDAKLPDVILDKLNATIVEVQALIALHQQKKMYASDYDMATALHDTGHIPLILSKATAAQQYARSTRSVSAGDLAEYFGKIPGARTQGIEYLVKQTIMQKIAQLYKETSDMRNTLEKQPQYFPCTRLMAGLEKEIFKQNEETMPAEYIQFDLHSAFRDKLHKLICGVNKQNDYAKLGPLVDRMIILINEPIPSLSNTVDVQKHISAKIYAELTTFLESKGFGTTDNMRITKELDVILQDVLPIAAYLNSEFNPFAQAGVFGEVVQSSFHKKALEAYKLHESKEYVSSYGSHQYEYDNTPRTERFNTEQIETLIFGPEDDAPEQTASSSSFLSRFSNTLSLLSAGSSVNTASLSQSAQRRARLALPATEEQKLLMPPEHESTHKLRK